MKEVGCSATLIFLLRNDFSDNLPPFEIIPGVYTYRQSNKRMLKVYEDLVNGYKAAKERHPTNKYVDNKINKAEALRIFFQKRCSVPNSAVS